MNILIIGGSGHVSGAVARVALAKGCTVYAVTRGLAPLPIGVVSLIADRHDKAAMKKVVAEQNMIWDLVVDCICYNPEDMLQDIELFTTRAKQFVFISTDFVYHPGKRKFPQPEDNACYVVTDNADKTEYTDHQFLYGTYKRMCEKMLIDGQMGSVNWTILRPCHIYGPSSELGCLPLHGRDPDLIDKICNGETIKLVGGGHFLQQPILVDDLAAVVLGIYNNHKVYNRIFNTAGPDIIESRQYYQIIADILGVGLNMEEISVDLFLRSHPEKSSFLCHRIYDLKALKEANLPPPSKSIEDGLKLHVEGLLRRKM